MFTLQLTLYSVLEFVLASSIQSYCYPGGISDNSTSLLNLIVCFSVVLFISCYSCFVMHFKAQYKLDQL
ncbi:hypothetical protein BDP27DRAFT_1342970, partial [Rhodocollybia butyracea]